MAFVCDFKSFGRFGKALHRLGPVRMTKTLNGGISHPVLGI